METYYKMSCMTDYKLLILYKRTKLFPQTWEKQS